MKINKSYLEQIIKEELESILLERPAVAVGADDEEPGDKHPTAKDFLGNPMMKGAFGMPVKWDATYDTEEEKEQHKKDMVGGAPRDVKLWRKFSKEMATQKALEPNSSIDAGFPEDGYPESYEEAPIQSIEKPAATKKPTTKKRRTKAQRQAILSKKIGRSVANIQNRIRKYYLDGSKTFASGEADGKYGRPGGETERAIKLFQKHTLKIAKPDGLWGKDTEKGYRKLAGKEKSWLMTPTLDKIPQKGKPQKALAKSTGIKSIEQLKKEKAEALKYAQVAYRGGFAEETKAKAVGRFKVARRALELAQAQEKIGKQQGIAKARGETNAERDTALARTRQRGR